MGRPIPRLPTPINKRRNHPSLRQLSHSLNDAGAYLRQASNSPVGRHSAINAAYRHAFRAAVALHAEHGASPSPSAPASLPAISPSALRLPRPRDYDLDRLLRRSERLPRLPLPPALRGPMADLAARSAQLVQQRRQLDDAAADMRLLHERLLADMERTAQHFVDAAHSASAVHGPGPGPTPSLPAAARTATPASVHAAAAPTRRPAARRPLPAGVIRARVRAAVTELPAAFRSASRAVMAAEEREAAAGVPSAHSRISVRSLTNARRISRSYARLVDTHPLGNTQAVLTSDDDAAAGYDIPAGGPSPLPAAGPHVARRPSPTRRAPDYGSSHRDTE